MALSVYLCYLLLWQQRNRIYLDLSKLNVSLVHFPLGLRSFQKLKDLKYSELYLSVLKLLQPQLTHLRVKSQQSLWISTILSLQLSTINHISHISTQLTQHNTTYAAIFTCRNFPTSPDFLLFYKFRTWWQAATVRASVFARIFSTRQCSPRIYSSPTISFLLSNSILSVLII